MVSQINPAVPASPAAYTADVRANFLHAKEEIEALQAGVAGPLVLTGDSDARVISGATPEGVTLWDIRLGDNTFFVDAYADDGTATTVLSIDRTSQTVGFNASFFQVTASEYIAFSAPVGMQLTGDLGVNGTGTFSSVATGVLGVAGVDALMNMTRYNTDSGSAVIRSHTANHIRWELALASYHTETGANAGSNVTLDRYDDSGAFIDTPLAIARSTGAVALSNGLGLFGAPAVTTKPTITGSRGTQTVAVLSALLTALNSYGIILNSTTA